MKAREIPLRDGRLAFPENRASLALHEQCGFRVVGYRERLGHMHGLWRNVVLMERRSETVGA